MKLGRKSFSSELRTISVHTMEYIMMVLVIYISLEALKTPKIDHWIISLSFVSTIILESLH